jgi:ABC-2 type transport system ATP-binding protein
MDVIEVKNLTKIYKALDFWKKDRVVAIKDVNLSIKKGEIFGLLGLNGAGKTTLMKVLLGLLKPTSGSVKILGGSIDDSDIRMRIGYLPELPYFPKYLKAGEILDYFAEVFSIPYSKKKARIKEVLGLVGLAGKGHIRVKALSKGMQGRLALAQAVINDPDLLFLDEPMSGLDPLGYKETRDILLSLNKRGRTIFFNSHILSEVERICDRVAVIHMGELLEVREVKDIRKKSRNMEEYFVKLVKSAGGVK